MHLKKKTARRLWQGFFCLFVALVAVDLWTESLGLPAPLRQVLLDDLRRRGLQVQAGSLRLGVWRGLELRDCTLGDPLLPGWDLVRADALRVRPDLLGACLGDPPIRSASLHGATFQVPLEWPLRDPSRQLRLTHVNALVERRADGVQVRHLQGLWEGFAFQAAGSIALPAGHAPAAARTNSARGAAAAPAKGWALTLRPWLPALNRALPPALVAAGREFSAGRQSGSRSEAVVRFDLGERLENSHATLDLVCSDMLFRGLDIRLLSLRASLANGQLSLPDLRLDLDEREYVQGHFFVDLRQGTWQGDMVARCYPRKVVRGFAPQLLSQVEQVSCEGPPPYFTLTVLPSPLARPEEWNLDLTGSLSDVRIVDARLRFLEGHARYRRGRLDFDQVRAVIRPDVQIEARGTWEIGPGRLVVDANIDGNPAFVAQFYPDPEFRRDYAAVWEAFAWGAARPSFSLSLYVDDLAGAAPTRLLGSAHMYGVSYNGVPLDEVEGNVFADFPAKVLLVDRLRVARNGRQLTGNLAWQWPPGRHRLDFACRGRLELAETLGLVDPAWAALPRNWQLGTTVPPELQLAGYYRHDDQASDLRLHARLALAGLKWHEASAEQTVARLEYDGHRLAGDLAARQVEFAGWQARGLAGRIVFDGHELNWQGKLERIAGADAVFQNVDGTASYRDRRLDVQALATRAEYAGWASRNVQGRGTWDGQALHVSAKAALVGRDRLQAEAVEATGDWNGQVLQLAARAATLGHGNDWRLRQVSAAAQLENRALAFSGEAATFGHSLGKGRGRGLRVTDGYWREDGVQCSLAVPTWRFLDGRVTLKETAADLAWHDGELSGALAIVGASHGASGQSGRLGGQFSWNGQNLRFKLGGEALTYPGLAVRDFVADGIYANQGLVGNFKSHSLTWHYLDLAQLEGTLRNDERYFWIPEGRAQLGGGTVNASFVHEYESHTGKGNLVLDDVGLDALVPPEPNDPNRLAGKLSGQTSLRYQSNAGKQLELFGYGHLGLAEAKLWEAPLIGEFLDRLRTVLTLGKVTGAKVGEITRADADFELKGDRIAISQLHTNGDLVSISASGFCWWRTGGLDLRVRAHPLDNTYNQNIFKKILGILPNPFTPLLEYRLTGTWKDRHWEQLSSIRDIVRDTENPSDPALKRRQAPPEPAP